MIVVVAASGGNDDDDDDIDVEERFVRTFESF